MFFTVGYNRMKREEFAEAVREANAAAGDNRVTEIYFSWSGVANGRSSLDVGGTLPQWEECERTLADLTAFSEAGLPLNLLLNGNCYGRDSMSRTFFNGVGDLVDTLRGRVNLASVTTSSLFIASFIRENFSGMEVKASVNMAIGSPAAAESVRKYFDSFYAKRELNRDLSRLGELKRWCDGAGIRLCGLANSGCLYDCPARAFHDNLVAHEAELAAMDNAYAFKSVCADYFKEHPERFLSELSFIRPEDVALYADYYSLIKLATRVSPRPGRVISAYMNGRFNGSLPELLEPDNSASLYPFVLDNRSLPSDFASRVTSCGKRCETCGWCDDAFRQAAIRLG